MRTNAERVSSDFDRFELCPNLQRGIVAAGFTEPRPIQSRVLPAALAGRDVLGLAQTGTGKTAAFALPILQRVASAGSRRQPRALIVAPTRELAQQIAAEVCLLGRHLGSRVATVYGGVSANRQIEALRRGVDVLIACPGRLLDLFGQREVALGRVEVLVLDEADHMFDMGFLPDIRRIVAALPADRQNLLFSATMPREIHHLADSLLKRPLVVELSSGAPAATIEHALYPVPEEGKLDLLRRLFATEGFRSAIVFTRTKHRAKRLARRLESFGHRAVALQGNMSQRQRDLAMEGFRRQTYDVLVATDIAARGIDVARVSHVINYDVPVTPDAYTHRIGRTGRAEENGTAFTFVTETDRALIRAIELQVGGRIQRRQIGDLPEVAPCDPLPKLQRSAPQPVPRARRRRRSGPRAGGARPHRRREMPAGG